MNGVSVPAQTGWELARAIGRITCEEYRADRLAAVFLSLFVTTERDGTTEPIKTWWVWGGITLNAARDALSRAYPLWPETVQSYREWKIPLMAMYQNVADYASQSLSLLAHAQAEADAAKAGDIIAMPELCDLPAVSLYLAEPWSGLLEAIRNEPLLPTLRSMPASEERLWVAGQEAVYEIWKRLGVTIQPHDDGRWGILVQAPTWADGRS
jgi:hypothetical protein